MFLVRAADLYLKERGTIGFVLPGSLFTADQHDDFRQAKFTKVPLEPGEIWALEGVNPLFNVPSCVLFMQKKEGARFVYPITGLHLTGHLGRRNSSLDEAEQSLDIETVEFSLSRVGKRSFWSTAKAVEAQGATYYAARFREGATIVPRSLWFVEVKASCLGFDPSRPPLETDQRARQHAKDPYRDLAMQGNVESPFLYATLLSTDLLPFGHLDYRLVVLPIEPTEDRYRLIPSSQAHWEGFFHMAAWLETAELEWRTRRRDKADRMTALAWLDYRRKLTLQDPQTRYRVLYPTSATYACACALENQPIEFDIRGQNLHTTGFIADYTTYYLETPNRDEALFVVAVLNAPTVDRVMKPMQARGQWGPRHICKKLLELPMPQFDDSNPLHLELARLGNDCADRVQGWLDSGGPGKVTSIGRLRTMVRDMLKQELGQIDELAESLLLGD